MFTARTHGAGGVTAAVEGGVRGGPGATAERRVGVVTDARPVAMHQAVPRQVRATPLPAGQGEREQRGHEEGEEGCSDGRHWHARWSGCLARGEAGWGGWSAVGMCFGAGAGIP